MSTDRRDDRRSTWSRGGSCGPRPPTPSVTGTRLGGCARSPRPASTATSSSPGSTNLRRSGWSSHLDTMVARARTGEPIQYVLGEWSFRHITLSVDRRVLIPRPETELVAEIAVGLAANCEPTRRVADLGTGSGAIGLSMAYELPRQGTEVWITDASVDAIDVARANLAGIGPAAANVRVAHGAWFEALPTTRCSMSSCRIRRTSRSVHLTSMPSSAIGNRRARCSPVSTAWTTSGSWPPAHQIGCDRVARWCSRSVPIRAAPSTSCFDGRTSSTWRFARTSAIATASRSLVDPRGWRDRQPKRTATSARIVPSSGVTP